MTSSTVIRAAVITAGFLLLVVFIVAWIHGLCTAACQ
jgi:hypothetical protein